MKPITRIFCIGVVTMLVPLGVQAQACDAHFTFDGNLSDSSGNGHDGVMIGKDGVTESATFVAGRSGQALQLDGNSAMRAFVDLHYDSCPQVTIAAWVDFGPQLTKGTKTILSTGGGSGPGLRASLGTLALNGTANGLRQSNVARANAGWMFLVGVYDYPAGTYKLYWRNRSAEATLSENRRPPEEAFWVGALNDGLSGAASGILIDDVQIIGRALTADEIQQLQSSGSSTEGSASSGIPGAVSGVEGTFAGGPQLSEAAQERMQEAAQDGMAPDLTYDTEEEGIAAAQAAEERRQREAYQADLSRQQNELERERREAAAAAEEESQVPPVYAVTYDDSVLRMTPVSGVSGDYTERVMFSARNGILHWVLAHETNDKPCRIEVSDARPAQGHTEPVFGDKGSTTVDVCDQGLPRIGLGLFSARDIVGDEFTPVTGIQVCTNGSNDRVKGIRAQARNVRYPEALYGTSQSTVLMDEKFRCFEWQSTANCPANLFAVGITLHFKDGSDLSPKDFLSGIALACSEVSWIQVN